MNADFFNELIHTLRTPLSVIHNDLSFINRQHPDLEADRTLRNVDKISSALTTMEEIVLIKDLSGVARALEKTGDWELLAASDGFANPDMVAPTEKVALRSRQDFETKTPLPLLGFYEKVIRKNKFPVILLAEKIAELSLKAEVTENILTIS